MRLLLLVLLAAGLPLQAAPAPTALPASLRARLQAVVDDPALATGFAGAIVVAAGRRAEADRQAGQFGLVPYDGAARPELFAHHADKVFTPASNLKLVTVAAALSRLGPDHRFTTRVLGPPPVNGRVSDLWLVGGGDPSLGYDDLESLADQVAAAGVTQVTGRVYGDASRYSGRYGYGWAVDDLPWYYGAEVSALTLGRNLVNLVVRPAAAGEPARVSVEPTGAPVQVESNAVTATAGSANSIDFDRDLDSSVMRVGGSIAADRETPLSQRMAVHRPARYAAEVFSAKLRAAGVSVAGEAAEGAPPGGARELATHLSAPLGELVGWLLKYSDNLYAELLLRELGVQSGRPGTSSAGVEAVVEYLREKQISTTGLRMTDGSGLSRYNLIAPRTLAGVLRAMAFSPHRQVWFAALPVAGEDGTLSSRMRGTAAAGRVNAKTGFISNHTGLSGYVTTRGGDLLIASTIWNHFTSPTAESRRCHDAFFTALAEWDR